MKTLLPSLIVFTLGTAMAGKAVKACPGLQDCPHGLSSGYIHGKGQFSISKIGETSVTLQADYNACGFNNQGEPSVCSEMAPIILQGDLIKKQDMGASTVYMIDKSEFGLVCWQSGRVFLVKFDSQGQIVDSVRLLDN